MRAIGKKTHWIHVASDHASSHFHYSAKRGSEGIEEGKILINFHGTLVHDFWEAYDGYADNHARCNAHLLRELKAFSDESDEGEKWASEIIKVLLEMKKEAEQARENNQEQIEEKIRQRLEKDYDKWVANGLKVHPEKTKEEGEKSKRGRIGQSKETNLLRRMRDKREEVIRFMKELGVPFDNNQAERDLRMIKVQQKVSGCFRSGEGARRFCTIMSYVSTIVSEKK